MFRAHDRVMVIGNFDGRRQALALNELPLRASLERGRLQDLHSGRAPELADDALQVPPYGSYWLTGQA